MFNTKSTKTPGVIYPGLMVILWKRSPNIAV
jgi:hypothetical protein